LPPFQRRKRWCAGHFNMLGASWFALAVGVGNKPPSLSWMRGTQGGRRKHAVADLVVSICEIKCCAFNRSLFNVLGKDVFGIATDNDPEHLWPEILCVVATTRRRAERLTREASRDDVNLSPPRCAVEELDVFRDSERVKMTFFLAKSKQRPAKLVLLNGMNRLPTEKTRREKASTGAREKSKLTQRPCHATSSLVDLIDSGALAMVTIPSLSRIAASSSTSASRARKIASTMRRAWR
jgi:hypothetical protein